MYSCYFVNDTVCSTSTYADQSQSAYGLTSPFEAIELWREGGRRLLFSASFLPNSSKCRRPLSVTLGTINNSRNIVVLWVLAMLLWYCQNLSFRYEHEIVLLTLPGRQTFACTLYHWVTHACLPL